MKTGVPRRFGGIDGDKPYALRRAARRWGRALSGWLDARRGAEGTAVRDAPPAATERRTPRICAMDENSRTVLIDIRSRLEGLAESVDAKAGVGRERERRQREDSRSNVGERLHDTDNTDETARSTVEGLGVDRQKRASPTNADPLVEAIRGSEERPPSVSEPSPEDQSSDLDAIRAQLEVILAAAMEAPSDADFDALLRGSVFAGPSFEQRTIAESLQALDDGLASITERSSELDWQKFDPATARGVDRLEAVEDEMIAIRRSLQAGLDAVDARLTDLLERAAPEDSERDRSRLAETEERIAELAHRLEAASQPNRVDATVKELKEDLKQDLDGIRSLAEDADRRMQEGLSSVHATLAQIIERLERIENGRGKAAAAEPLEATGTYGVTAVVPEKGPRLRAVDQTTVRSPGPYADRWNGSGSVRTDLAALRELAMSARHGLRETPTGRRADFIAAARRATQVATEEEGSSADVRRVDDGKAGAFARVSEAIRNRRRTLLATSAGMLIAVSAVYAVIPAKTPDRTEFIDLDGDLPAAPTLERTARGSLERPPRRADRATFAFAHPEKLDSRFGETPPSPPTHTFVRAVHRAASLPIDEAVGTIELRRAAAAGNPIAAVEVAARYAKGGLVPRDLVKAAQWYELAAEQGDAVAQYRIASLYQRGQGVAKDLEAAADWYRRAAEQGNAGAMHNLGVMRSDGVGGRAGHDEAVKWFRAAADRGIQDSQYNLGVIYARGLGVDRDLVESYKWFALAANTRDPEAVARRDEVDNALSSDDRAKAHAAVDAWRQKPIAARANEVASLPDAWADPSAGITEANRRSLVTKIQTLLAEHGYDPGPADGLEGPKTRNAVRAFQRKIGLAETGTISSDVVAALANPAG